MKVIKERTITPRCIFDCEMTLGPDASIEAEEIYEIFDESVAILIPGKASFVSISDFKNAAGQSIGEFLIENHPAFAVSLSKEF